MFFSFILISCYYKICIKVYKIFNIFNSLIFSSIIQKFYFNQSNIVAYLDLYEFENMFKDSGYWDYFVLSFYDNLFRIYAVHSLFVSSDFLIIEKASWLLVGITLWPININFFIELKTLGEFFFYIIIWIFIFFNLNFFMSNILCII